ncbi:2OG-Fe(II) oxygenase superfamily protein [Annulohypoxylon truncatum]|uniref:2OG-Fe(II) oxygenase superfamily protein n=1 Tax=Annulohypoxylon truncatum TaxID=327061 RepID=UPI00200842F4|nr:2OG-Fe(II) oxygenase superfamily protein [Annulohypoxylon truncatum]KAI1215114.1 2OG-Fe(II) oxygenase superfamily protein [Annulohypoxylon truncatum]
MAVTASIPIIDISAEGTDQAQVAKELVDAAVEYGFVYIRNAGRDISTEQIENAFDISRILFSSPLEDKQRCKIEKNNQGWSGMHSETLDPKTQRVGDFKEAFNFGPFTDNKATQPIPQSIESHQAQLAAFKDACHNLCRKLLLLFGIGLGVNPPDFFTAAHDPTTASGSILRLLYYPPPSSTPAALSSDVRAGAHSDYGSVTLLFRLRGQAGLELLDPRTESWAPVPVVPPGTETDAQPPILVNIGDLLSYWTNGLLRSTVHRVAFSPSTTTNGESATDPRYSIAYFCHPADATPLSAVPSERVAAFRPSNLANGNSNSNPYAERKVMTAKEHLQMRLRATYFELYEGGEKGVTCT